MCYYANICYQACGHNDEIGAFLTFCPWFENNDIEGPCPEKTIFGSVMKLGGKCHACTLASNLEEQKVKVQMRSDHQEKLTEMEQEIKEYFLELKTNPSSEMSYRLKCLLDEKQKKLEESIAEFEEVHASAHPVFNSLGLYEEGPLPDEESLLLCESWERMSINDDGVDRPRLVRMRRRIVEMGYLGIEKIVRGQ
ncbi:hypothetical protein RUND412_001663 [Rhizina undulata]